MLSHVFSVLDIGKDFTKCYPLCFFVLDIGKDTTNVPESNFKTRMKDTFNIGKQEDLRRTMNKKLQIMLEETLMKNIELQKVFIIDASNC